MEKNKVYNDLLSISKRLAKRKEGALFIIAKEKATKKTYELLYPQVAKKKKLHEKGMHHVLERLSTLDGATIITPNGSIVAYGAKINKTKAVPGYGTRHAAAAGITRRVSDSTAILVSEESGWIRIFQDGKMVLETDSQDNPRSVQEKIVSFLTDKDTALLTAAGASTAIIGSAAVAPVLVVGGTYLAIKTAAGVIKKNL
tara:strand:+ start:6505 stop:7104 length:600 start_codon:yes stop_codon:yes gene_type:complete